MRSLVPADPDKKFESVSLRLARFDIGTRPSRWQPGDAAARVEALAHAKPISALAARHPTRRADLDAAVAKTGFAAGVLVYISMITFREEWVALLDAAKGDVVGDAPVDGF